MSRLLSEIFHDNIVDCSFLIMIVQFVYDKDNIQLNFNDSVNNKSMRSNAQVETIEKQQKKKN
jgi:hypothetical protein